MKSLKRIVAMAAVAAGCLSLAASPVLAQGAPVRVGSTLALTGPLSATALVHKLVGEIYVEDLNSRGGLLGRKVEWIVKDDQSKPDVARTLYEQLVTSDKVDLLMGPYATGAILSAIGVAQRYNKMLIHHTMGVPSLAKYDMHFPAWSLGPDPGTTVPNTLFDALAASPKPPKTIAIVTSKFPSLHFLSLGAREVAKKRGLQEVLFLEWEFGNRDFGPIAARVKDAKPDLVFVGDIGLEGNMLLEAMKKLDYEPPLHFHLYPAPGPMATSPETKNALSVTIFEEHAPFTNDPVAAKFVKTYNERAKAAGFPYTKVEVQAAASFTAWQLLEASVVATKSLDDKKMADWLKANQVKTIQGTLRFDKGNNFGDDLMRIKQVQNGNWVTVWPKEWAAPGATLKQ
ncbi:ABC transporter substrate-binding protein [Ferrovibrio terrae]|jgi:ABC-type branched-subunit amino acid transport system substrate-binding protein|uniref:ABC transporter substrate-binding protein n=1 Tax=Ferrovibrio terrae TaxID=2594003 RepID=A0A516H3N9_9PROT|nr:amino acid ABC transporter substrate-binding protein [Ferrovibrio terrae]QDO98392.1 ABC transporter substrate-binding protein [Ferrovibrio terrae]